jgi:membrane-associated phospholipid phosphatase
MKSRSLKAVLAIAFIFLFCQASPDFGQAQEYRLSWAGDATLLGAGLGTAIVSQFLLQNASTSSLGPIDIEKVNGFDRLAVFGYSHPLDVTSDIFEYTTAAVPAMLAFLLRFDQSASIGVVYLETLSFAFAAKNLLKYLVPRYRPYLYSDLPAGTGPAKSEYGDSFPSGHATIAFTAAAFSVYTFHLYFPSSSFLLPLALTSYGLATLTATFRVVSGMHFLTDVLAGALLGTTLGFLVPLVHRAGPQKSNENRISLLASPDAIMLRFSW